MAGLHGECRRWWGTPILWDLHEQVLLTELLLLGPGTCQFAACFKHLSAGIPARPLFSCRILSCCLSRSFPRRGWLCAPVPGAWTGLRLLSSSAASQGRCHSRALSALWRLPSPPRVLLPPAATSAAPTAPTAQHAVLVTDRGRPHGWEAMGRGC